MGDEPCQQASLKILDGSSHTPLSEGIPYTRQDCFELVDWTGRALRADKRGVIDESQAPILKRLGSSRGHPQRRGLSKRAKLRSSQGVVG